MRVTRMLLTMPSLLCLGATPALAQGQALPSSQPALITIYREQVKLGRGTEHERIEAGWPAAYAKAKSPNYYLGMTSLTGPNEAWFIAPFASYAAVADQMKLESSDTALAAELARLYRADAEVLTDLRVIQAIARTDLSHGAFPDLAKMRFWEITIFRVRPGRESDFEADGQSLRCGDRPGGDRRQLPRLPDHGRDARARFSGVHVGRVVCAVRRHDGKRAADDAELHARGAGHHAEVLDRGPGQFGDEPLRAQSDDELRVGGNAGDGCGVLDAEAAGAPAVGRVGTARRGAQLSVARARKLCAARRLLRLVKGRRGS